MHTRLPQQVVVVLAEGIKVGADGALEQDGLLRNDCDRPANIPQAELRDVKAVELDGSARGLHNAEERLEHGGLARARAAAHADLLPGSDCDCQILQHRREVRAVPELQLVEGDGTCAWGVHSEEAKRKVSGQGWPRLGRSSAGRTAGRPILGGAAILDDGRSFLVQRGARGVGGAQSAARAFPRTGGTSM